MKRPEKKIKNCSGETLVETLASILIGSLSVILLVSMIMASVSINRKAEKYDEEYYSKLNGAERQDAGDIYTPEVASGKAVVTISVKDEALSPVDIEVTCYGGEGVCSYAKKETTGP